MKVAKCPNFGLFQSGSIRCQFLACEISADEPQDGWLGVDGNPVGVSSPRLPDHPQTV